VQRVELSTVLRRGAWLSGMGRHSAAANLYNELIFSVEAQADYDLRAEALACYAAALWCLGSPEPSDSGWCIPVIEEAVERETGSVAEARALLTGVWICSRGGQAVDPSALGFLDRAQAIIATHPWDNINYEWMTAVRLATDLTHSLPGDPPEGTPERRVRSILDRLKCQGEHDCARRPR